MRLTEEVKVEEPFDGDGNNIYYINVGRCSGKVNRTVNELVEYANNLQKQNQKYKEVIDKAIEYLENNSLYKEEYDYDYEENSYLSGIDDETAKKDLLKILRGEINMNKERAIYFAGLMEEYLNIPSYVCENIENELINGEYYKVINYVIERRKELENKANYEAYQEFADIVIQLQQENKKLKDNWNKLKKELKDKFEEYRYVEDECLRTMAQEDDSILFSMSCIEKGDSNE